MDRLRRATISRRGNAPIVVVWMLVASLLTLTPTTIVSAATVPADEQVFVAKINSYRAANGLGRLTVDSELTTQARRWTETMVADADLRHASDLSVGISTEWLVLGENVGVDSIHDLDRLFAAFVSSPSHQANLLDARYNRVGVGVVHGADGKVWTTHRFMAAANAEPASAPITAPPTTGPPTTVLSTTLRLTTTQPLTTTRPTTTRAATLSAAAPPTTGRAPTAAAASPGSTTVATPGGASSEAAPSKAEPTEAEPSTAPPSATRPPNGTASTVETARADRIVRRAEILTEAILDLAPDPAED